MVIMLLGTGFEEAEAVVPLDLLRRADIPVFTAGLDGRAVSGSHGIQVHADLSLSEVKEEQVEMLILPGGMGGVSAISSSQAALSLIRRVYERGKWLAAICAAPTILAGMGLLDGRKAVCYPGMEGQMEAAAVQKGNPVVVDGTVITAEAAGSAFAFGLKLVEILKGEAAAQAVRHAVYYHF